jgi:hypothetical protein
MRRSLEVKSGRCLATSCLSRSRSATLPSSIRTRVSPSRDSVHVEAWRSEGPPDVDAKEAANSSYPYPFERLGVEWVPETAQPLKRGNLRLMHGHQIAKAAFFGRRYTCRLIQGKFSSATPPKRRSARFVTGSGVSVGSSTLRLRRRGFRASQSGHEGSARGSRSRASHAGRERRRRDH